MSATVPARGVLIVLAAASLAACSSSSGGAVVSTTVEPGDTAIVEADAVGTLSSAVSHEISISIDEAEYLAMIDTFSETGAKDWIESDVTIDGVTYETAGIRLKGNSSLAGLGGFGGRGGPDGFPGGPGGDVSADEPEGLPWLIRLDKFVDDQTHDGLTDLVVRSNSSETSLNEAVALDLLELSGLASQDAIATSFSVNDSEPVLRLVIEHPDDMWMAEEFSDEGALYKAESSGDYSYRGEDPESYDEVFDQEAGKQNADLEPLIGFLDFINNADDATFKAQLGDHLDVESFATYLAMQDLIGNFDDIDGPGNNSYLYWDPETDRFTVVPWDHNLAFGGFGGGGGGPGGGRGFPGAGEGPGEGGPGAPIEGDRGGPGGFGGGGPGGGPGGGFGGLGNILVERFTGDADWQAMIDSAKEDLSASLFESGVADQTLADWVEIVASTDLVDGDTITSEAAAVAAGFTQSDNG